MTHPAILSPEVERTAKAALKRAVLRGVLRQIVIKDSEAFNRFHGQLKDAMTRAWGDAARKAIAAALDRLREIGPGQFTEKDASSILSVIEEQIGKTAIAAAMREPVINLSDAIFRSGVAEVAMAGAVDIGFGRPDLDAIDTIKKGNIFAVGNSWDAVNRAKVNAILLDYFQEGMNREQLTNRLATDFAHMTEKSRHYWENLADHFSTKGRELGRVTAYERAGIQYVQIRAQLDDKTTEICRGLHGRVIAVSRLSEQKTAYLDAVAREDSLGAQAAWKMHSDSADFSSVPTSKLASNTGSPPYHFKCRTITVAYFPPVR